MAAIVAEEEVKRIRRASEMDHDRYVVALCESHETMRSILASIREDVVTMQNVAVEHGDSRTARIAALILGRI